MPASGKNAEMPQVQPLFTRNGFLNVELKDVLRVLRYGDVGEKIRALESLSGADDPRAIRCIVELLDDDSIRVRGEAFSSLMLNGNDIARFLVDSLDSDSKNIRGYSTLVLANRGDAGAARHIAKLVTDGHPSVRACALGALGHLGARESGAAIRRCLADPDMEVRKSAIKAMIDIGESLQEDAVQEILQKKDPEIDRLLTQAKKAG